MMQETDIHLTAGDALLIVDVQNDFLPGGALGVTRGDEIVPVLNRYIRSFESAGLPVYASRDWHPADHCSFKAQGGIWPPHCIAGTAGAAFAAELALPEDATVISKAATREKDAYSAFEQTDLADTLRARGIHRVFVGGLTTDYCVLNTVRDALEHGFEVCLLQDAIRAVDLDAGDGRKAQDEMHRLGARPIHIEALAA